MQIREAPARLFNELTRLAVGGLKAIADEDIDTSDIPEAIVRKYYPPDVTACIYWTKNRMPEKWRNVQRHEGPCWLRWI